MIYLIGVVAILVGVVLAIRWAARRAEEISGFYADDEDDPVTETLLYMDQAKGNTMF